MSRISRRDLMRWTAGGLAASALGDWPLRPAAASNRRVPVFSVEGIPRRPFRKALLGEHRHAGVDCLLYLMSAGRLPFYRSLQSGPLSGRRGLIATDDVVLIKVNATWKHRGNTNSDVLRGLVQAILDHPDGFTGEVVVFENSQGWGSLECDTPNHYDDSSVAANANRAHHSFRYVVETMIADPRVSARLLDLIGETFIDADDHTTEGYRILEDVSYPCFFTAGGRRVELREGIWTGSGYAQNLKLINLPVLKHHDRGGSEITGAVKHVYGILTMQVDQALRSHRHYAGLGETCGKMFASVRAPVLNIMDAVWVSHASLRGYPEETTTRLDRLAASQDPVALDAWCARNILYPIDQNPRHHPEFATVRAWLRDSRRLINSRGGLWSPEAGLRVGRVTDDEERMRVWSYDTRTFLRQLREGA